MSGQSLLWIKPAMEAFASVVWDIDFMIANEAVNC